MRHKWPSSSGDQAGDQSAGPREGGSTRPAGMPTVDHSGDAAWQEAVLAQVLGPTRATT